MAKLKNLIVGGMILPSLLFGKLAKADVPKSLEEVTFSPPYFSSEWNVKKNDYNPILPQYSNFYSGVYFSLNSNDSTTLLRPNTNFSLITIKEQNEVVDILKDIQNRKINSYGEFVEKSKKFAPYQKLFLGSLVGGFAGTYNYDIDDVLHDRDGELFSQNDFFSKFQDSLSETKFVKTKSGWDFIKKFNPLGKCKQIHLHAENFLRNSGAVDEVATIGGPVFSGGDDLRDGHAYVPFKIGNQTGILDYGEIILANTKNIEKILRVYQKMRGLISMEHEFFENSGLKHKLITKEGKHYLDFADYGSGADSGLGTEFFKKNVLKYDVDSEPFVTTVFNQGDYVNSGEFNFFGLFFKGGEIRGDIDSSLKKINLYQYGFKKIIMLSKQFDFLEGTVVGFEFTRINGEIFQDRGDENVEGYTSRMILASNRDGFNFGGEIYSCDLSSGVLPAIISETSERVSFSYKFASKYFDIKPYTIFQFSNRMTEFASETEKSIRTESQGGLMFNFKLPKNIEFLIDSYFSKRLDEKEYGGSAKLKHKNFEIFGEWNKINSSYWANPDEHGMKIGGKINLEHLQLEIDYSEKTEDYDGEKETEKNTTVRAIIKI